MGALSIPNTASTGWFFKITKKITMEKTKAFIFQKKPFKSRAHQTIGPCDQNPIHEFANKTIPNMMILRAKIFKADMGSLNKNQAAMVTITYPSDSIG